MAEESFWFIFLSLIFSLLFRQMLKLNAGLCFHYETSESLQEPGVGFHSLSPFPPSFLLGRAGHGMLASEGGLARQGRCVSGLPRQPGDSSLSRTGAPVCSLGPVLQTVPLNKGRLCWAQHAERPVSFQQRSWLSRGKPAACAAWGSPGLRVTDSSVAPVSAFLLMPELCFCFCSGTG